MTEDSSADASVDAAPPVDAATPGDDGAVTPGDSGLPPTDANPPADGAGATIDTVSPTCVDGQYREVLPTGAEPVADVAYDPANLSASALAYLDRRYPTGAAIVRGCVAANGASRCVDSWVFPSGRANAQSFMLSLSTVVHEGGHLYDLSLRRGFGTYYLTEATRLSCDMGDAVGRGGQTFARSELHADSFQSQFRACASLTERGCDSYAFIYLDPSRADAGVGPMQGFASLLEETTQYVNSLATGYVFRDQLGRSSKSERDGILAFLWYIERYLYLARTARPEVYAFLSGSECWRNAILTVWGRAWLYLEHSADARNLEIYASNFMTAVRNPVLLEEIQRLRTAHGCR